MDSEGEQTDTLIIVFQKQIWDAEGIVSDNNDDIGGSDNDDNDVSEWDQAGDRWVFLPSMGRRHRALQGGGWEEGTETYHGTYNVKGDLLPYPCPVMQQEDGKWTECSNRDEKAGTQVNIICAELLQSFVMEEELPRQVLGMMAASKWTDYEDFKVGI